MTTHFFNYHNHILHIEDLPLTEIAQRYGTPTYVYSRATIEQNWLAFHNALGNYPHKICYAVKANSNLAVLNILKRLGSGFDIVSGGELARVMAAGGDPQQLIFSGVGKQIAEIKQALAANIYCFNVESIAELIRLNEIAGQMQTKASIALRINPDIDAGTHPYISTGLKENKFGIAIEDALSTYLHAAQLPNIKIIGVGCHIGSQLTETAPYVETVERLLTLIDELAKANIHIQHLDIGGGFGITYQDENPPSFAVFCAAILTKLAQRKLLLILEPGRAIVGNAGILLTRVEHLKPTAAKNFAIIDAAMNDLIRPALYEAWQAIIPVNNNSTAKKQMYDVVGPVCETGDFLGKDRQLAINEGDLLAICTAGAYGFTMSSNYNSRGRAAEVMVDGQQSYLIRPRELINELFANEQLLP